MTMTPAIAMLVSAALDQRNPSPALVRALNELLHLMAHELRLRNGTRHGLAVVQDSPAP